MCGKKLRTLSTNSGTGLLRLLLFVACLLLLASPSWAAADWFFLRDTNAETTQAELSLEEKKQAQLEEMITPILEKSDQPVSVEPSELLETPSTNYKEETRQTFQTALQDFAQELDSSKLISKDLRAKSENLQSQWKAYQELESVEDKAFDEAVNAVAYLETQNVEQADRIAELNKEAGSKAFALVGTFIGFDSLKPLYGVTFDLGVRIGSSLLMQAGVEYELASFDNMLNFEPFSLDNMRFTAKIGWMW